MGYSGQLRIWLKELVGGNEVLELFKALLELGEERHRVRNEVEIMVF